MPFSATELQAVGLSSLDHYQRNKPIDQVGYERPFLRRMMKGKRAFPGGKESVVENLRYQYGSNLQWYYGDQLLTYNRRNTLKHAKFPWRSAHDGFSLHEDDLFQNGIEIDEGGKTNNHSEAELLRLVNLMDEQTEVMREGFEEKFELELLRDGTQDANALEGLDALLATDPSSGTVGGIDRATYGWWRNNAVTGIAGTNLIDTMEKIWRQCCRVGGGRPDFIAVGSKFLDEYRIQSKGEVQVQKNQGGNGTDLDPSVSGLYFKGVPLVWIPAFEELDNLDAPAIEWEKRCYFINSKRMRLRPAQGYDMKTRTPPRVYDRYAYYWGLQWKGALCMSQSNAHAVMSIA